MRHRPLAHEPSRAIGHRTRSGGDGGYVLATMGLVLIPLMLFTAFAVDVGGWYARGAKLQRAADAAALAGAARMPDFNAAEAQALVAAQLNGVVDNATIDIDVNQGSNDRQLRVTITDRNVQRFLSSIVLQNMTIKRSSIAEFVLPVPLGSPDYYFGSDPFPVGPFTEPGLWGNIHGEQTDNQKGDRYAAGCRNTGEAGCATKNTEHVGSYLYSIDVPAGSPTIDVEIFDAGIFERQNEQTETGDTNYGTQTAQTTTWELFHRDNTPIDASDNIELHTMASGGPSAERCSTDPGRWVIPQGANYGATPTAAQAAVATTYRQKWVRICRKTSAQPGRYYLRVTSSGNGNSANRYSVRVRSSSATKPRLSAYQNMSMFNNDLGSNPSFYLAQVDPVHKGKTLIVNLYDPGEIGVPNARMVVQKPHATTTAVISTSCKVSVYNNPTDNDPVNATPTTYSPCSIPTTNGTGGGLYAGRLLKIEVDLGTTYTCATCWWKVTYDLGANPLGNPADTTTWSAAIKGDPVHLINE
jgi:hypothetical protein